MTPSNRNIIKLEELKQEVEDAKNSASEDMERKGSDSPYLSDDQVREVLDRYKGRIPSLILRDIYEMLKGRRVTEKQLEKIIERVESSLDTDMQLRKIDDIYRKLENLERILKVEAAEKAGMGIKKPEGEADVADRISAEAMGEQKAPALAEVRKPDEMFVQDVERESMRTVGTNTFSEDGEMPRLTRVPEDTKSIMMLLKWIEYLIERVGYEGLEDALNYYVDINWISEDVLMTVLRYARGIKLYHDNSDWRPIGYLNVQDHLMSLLFIEALRTGRFNKNLVMEVEREVYRMKKEVAELHGL